MGNIKPKTKLKLKDMAKRRGDKSGSGSAGGGRRRASTGARNRRSQYSGEWTPSMGTPF